MLNITNECNMELMARYPDNYFDLAIVDPPYGLGNRLSDGGGKLKNTPMAALYRDKDWDILPKNKSLFYAKENCGLPIGNLTSQLFSNIYMNILLNGIYQIIQL